MKIKHLIIASAALAFAGSASAGNFEIWSDSSAKAGYVTAIVSFTGDGATQDAQADIAFGDNLSLVKAVAKVPGSVCVGLPQQNKIRVVPPSGAGQALAAKATDYCAFTFKAKGGASSPGFRVAFTECAASGGSQNCGSEATDVSAK